MGAALGLMLGVGLFALASAVATGDRRGPVSRPRIAGDRLLAMSVGAVGAGVPVGWLTGDALAASVVGAVGAAAVPLARSEGERRRRRSLTLAWPAVVDPLLGALQAGLDLHEAAWSVARHAPGALRTEVEVLARDLDSTGDPVRALVSLQRRLADPSSDRVVEALLLGLETGQAVRVLGLLADELRRDAAACARRSSRRARTAVALGLAAVGPWAALALLPPWAGRVGATWPAGPMIEGLALSVTAAVLADRALHVGAGEGVR